MYRELYCELHEGDTIKPHFWSRPINITKIVVMKGEGHREEFILIEGLRKISNNFCEVVKAKFHEYKEDNKGLGGWRHHCWILGKRYGDTPLNRFYVEKKRIG
jgi:hypothetical protein